MTEQDTSPVCTLADLVSEAASEKHGYRAAFRYLQKVGLKPGQIHWQAEDAQAQAIVEMLTSFPNDKTFRRNEFLGLFVTITLRRLQSSYRKETIPVKNSPVGATNRERAKPISLSQIHDRGLRAHAGDDHIDSLLEIISEVDREHRPVAFARFYLGATPREVAAIHFPDKDWRGDQVKRDVYTLIYQIIDRNGRLRSMKGMIKRNKEVREHRLKSQQESQDCKIISQ